MCKKLKCTRCHYELKGTENYCPRCGVILKDLPKEKAIELLKLMSDGYSVQLELEKVSDCRTYFSERINALEMAIKSLERTAHEVSINKQENLISLNISIDKEKFTREIIKLINDSQANKNIGLLNF